MTHLSRYASSVLIVLAALVLTAVPAQATPLILHFSDPVGDGTSTIDLSGMHLSFDNATGAYTILMTATSAKPFLGAFRLNVNLFNADRDSELVNTGFFSDTLNDFNLDSSATEMSWTGISLVLKNWHAGDRVAINESAFGVPAVFVGPPVSMTAFHTEVLDFLPDSISGPLWGGEDQVFGEPYSTVQDVPDAGSSLLLLGIGLAGLRVWRGRRG